MSMVAADMSSTIQSKMSTLPSSNRSAVDSQNKFAEGAKEYLEANLEIQFVWTAQTTTTPPVVDTTVLMEGKIRFPSFTLTPPGSGGLLAWGNQIYSQMLGGIISPVKDAVSSPLDYFVITPQTLGPIPWALLVGGNETVYPDGLTNICGQIITRIKTMIQALPFLPATHVVSGVTYVASVCQMSLIL